MTIQAGDILSYNGEKTTIATEPLKPYLEIRSDVGFIYKSTALVRGYVGRWEIKSKKSEQRYLQLFLNKSCLYIEIAKINKIEIRKNYPNKETLTEEYKKKYPTNTEKIQKTSLCYPERLRKKHKHKISICVYIYIYTYIYIYI